MKRIVFSIFSIFAICCTTKPLHLKASPSILDQAASLPVEANKVTLELTSFDEEPINALIAALQEQDNQGNTIYLRINSNGGSVSGMFTLTQAMEQLKQPVTCVVDWHAFSAGSFILEQPGCAKRLATKRSLFLFHEPSSAADGNEHSINETQKMLHALSEVLVNQVAARIKMSEKEFRQRIYNQSWTFGYEDALKYHVIDGIIDVKDIPPLVPVVVPKSLLQQLLGN